MLEVVDLHAYYALAHVLRGVSLQSPAGRVVALLGRNGAGKTTLVRSLMELAPPQVRAGSVRYNGRELRGLTPHEIARLGIALVPQGRRVFRSLTVLEHLQIAARPPRNGDGAAWDPDRVFDLFPRLAERKANRGGALSGGEQQMLAIARALMGRPRLLLLDEPSLGLAPLIVREIFGIIRDLHAAGVTILLVEQNARLALQTADHGHVLETGQITISGAAADLLADDRVREAYLG